MRKLWLAGVLLGLVCLPVWADDEAEVRKIITQFQEGMAAHDLSKIEPLVAEDMVAFENGGRNDGWADMRDNHMGPEFEGPAPPMEWELVRVVASPQMAWGYTKTTISVTRRDGEKMDLLLWSIYVLENRSGDWKITVLDWSLRVPRRRPSGG